MRLAIFVAVAVGTYVAVLAVVLAITLAQGGGISCGADCPPIQDFLGDVAPWGAIVGVAASVICGALAALRRAQS